MFKSDRLPEKLFTASFESNEAFWHLPALHATSTAPLQPAPFIYLPPPSCHAECSGAYARSIAQALHMRSGGHRARRLLFGVLFGCISTLSPNKEGKAKPGEQESILSLSLSFNPAFDKPQGGACLGITAQSRAQ